MAKVLKHGVYKTKQTHLKIEGNLVTKTFLPSRHHKLRFHRESTALDMMSELDHVSKIVHLKNDDFSIVMARLEGTTPSSLSVNNVRQLRLIVQGILESGVARHAIPIRDLLVTQDDQLSMVDFERVSLRRWRFSPFWLIACIVTQYYMYRLIGNHQPQTLSKNEHLLLQSIHFIRTILKPFKKAKRLIRKTFSKS